MNILRFVHIESQVCGYLAFFMCSDIKEPLQESEGFLYYADANVYASTMAQLHTASHL